MALQTKSDVPENLYWEANRYAQLATATDRTSTGTFSETSTSSGTTYAGTGGTDELLTLLEVPLAIHNFRATDHNLIVNTINDSVEIKTATISTREMQFTIPSWTFADNRFFKMQLATAIPSGTAIQCKINNDTALVAKDTAGADLLTLSAGYYTVIAKDDTPDFFTVIPF